MSCTEYELRISRQWQRLIEEAQEAAKGPLWEPINENTIRYAEWRLETPDWILPAQWPWETYDRFVFLSFFPGSAIILGVSPCPWIGRRDLEITQKRAREIMRDPAKLFVTQPTQDTV